MRFCTIYGGFDILSALSVKYEEFREVYFVPAGVFVLAGTMNSIVSEIAMKKIKSN